MNFQLSFSPQTTRLLLIGLGILGAGLLGAAVSLQATWVFAGLLTPVGGLLLIASPALGMFLMIASLPLESAVALEGITITRVLGIGVFGTWIAHKMLHRESWNFLWSTSYFFSGMLVVFFGLISIFWAKYTSDTIIGIVQLTQLFLWSLLIIDLTTSWERTYWVVRILVMAGLPAAIVTLQQYFLEGAKRAGAGVAAGINGTAALLVLLLPFAFYLFQNSKSRFWRLVGLLYIILGSGAVFVTFSRTSYILLFLTIIIHYWKFLTSGTGRSLALVFTGVVLIASFFIPQDLITERIQTIGPAIQGLIETTTGTATSNDSRGLLWTVGITMFLDYPILGVGYNNYGRYFLYEYQFLVPGGGWISFGVGSTHNSYITFLANQGLVGLLVWLGMFGTVLYYLIKSWFMLIRTGFTEEFSMVQAVTYSLCLKLIYGLALNVHQDKLFWLLLGLSIAVFNLAKQTQPAPPTVEPALIRTR